MRRISSKLTYGNVMSTIAVFVALGGGAYAASRFVGPTGAVKLCEYTAAPIATTTTAGPSNVAQILCSGGSSQTIFGGNLTIAAIPLAALN
jgi:hypothetical protein